MRAIVMKEYGGPECLVPAERPTGAGFGKVVLTIAFKRRPRKLSEGKKRTMTGRVRYEVDDRGAAFVTLDARSLATP